MTEINPKLIINYCDSGYEKSSFDRFGDDLTELILSYLTIEDKYRFECLSKRIQCFVFTKQLDFRLDCSRIIPFDTLLLILFEEELYLSLILEILTKTLKKLQFLSIIELNGIDIFRTSKIFRVIADNCEHLRHLSVKVCPKLQLKEDIEYFGHKCGPNLESLQIDCERNDDFCHFETLISLSPNLLSMDILNSDNFLEIEEKSNTFGEVLPKLKEIAFNVITENQFNSFANQYSDNILRLELCLDDQYLGLQSKILIISSIGRFRRLQSLAIDLFLSHEDFVQGMKTMAKTCTQLKHFSLSYYRSFKDFRFLSSLTSLTCLKVNSNWGEVNHKMFDGLDKLTKLRRFEFRSNVLSDECLVNCGKNLSQLESFSIAVKKSLSDKTLQYLSELKSLKSLQLKYNSGQKSFTDFGIKYILENSLQLRQLTLWCRNGNPFEISIETIDALKAKAKQNPRTKCFLELKGFCMKDRTKMVKQTNLWVNRNHFYEYSYYLI